MLRFEICNAKSCAEELLALGKINMKMWYLFEWLTLHDELRHGTQAEVVKLYIDEQLVAYSLLENYEACTDKIKSFKGRVYQDLGVIHFVTVPAYRKKGYASLLAEKMYQEVIKPLLARYPDVIAYVTATGRAVPLMQRTGIKKTQLVTQFYSDLTFEQKVVIPLSC
ncbi:GNAT family N-acetyltransferase [Psychromonas algicola]|uniref:GNAT family N-acetyltransferase n=1 Tax=Psychromonas algicola TaxID=2555642 RepID=UPI0010687883|nr:GNAT family N-acetyltransferase [Psychromonas sp. RZ5]TEW52570.1 GNAT family N-acetyltransferase [Psychromonas sp. RZ5]